ncbi:hypothetical protein CC2G_009245 [Coprinopsis cinerea AmutBmut pab1-1]|nr:hypothetical protein CC2G_009245 [Coprinopsis cinerea AmutBmut pab1-1]
MFGLLVETYHYSIVVRSKLYLVTFSRSIVHTYAFLYILLFLFESHSESPFTHRPSSFLALAAVGRPSTQQKPLSTHFSRLPLKIDHALYHKPWRPLTTKT